MIGYSVYHQQRNSNQQNREDQSLMNYVDHLQNSKNRRIIAFDMDGTLIDSSEATSRCLSDLHLMLGLEKPSKRDFAEMHGDCAAEFLRQIIVKKSDRPFYYLHDIVNWAIHTYPKHYLWRYSRRLAQVPEMIKAASEFGQLVIISSNVDSAVSEFIQKEGLSRYLWRPPCRSEFESKRNRLVNALELNGISSTRAVYVGDSVVDITLGRELGIRTIGVAELSNDAEELRRMADATVGNVAEVPSVLNQWSQDSLF